MNMSTHSLDVQRALRPKESAGQWNLFTGELEPIPAQNGELPEPGWLFDPEWGMVLPKDLAGRNWSLTKAFRFLFPTDSQKFSENHWSLGYFRSAQKSLPPLRRQRMEPN